MSTVTVIDSKNSPRIPIVIGEGVAKVVTWPGNGARYRTFQLLNLSFGAKTVVLTHPCDSVYYIIGGEGVVVDVASNIATDIVEGSMIHIDRGDTYQFEARHPGGMVLLGGPCPADERLYVGLTHQRSQ